MMLNKLKLPPKQKSSSSKTLSNTVLTVDGESKRAIGDLS